MCGINVIHLSLTPLVGVPGKAAAILSKLGCEASTFVAEDYPGDTAGIFLAGVNLLKGSPEVELLLRHRLPTADIVHIHNFVRPALIELVKTHAPNARFVYQVHTNLREGPVYFERADHMGIDFAARLVVAQHQTRDYPDYEPIPNMVDAEPSVSLVGDHEPVRLLYRPSQTRSGNRWGDKVAPALDHAVKVLADAGLIEAILPKAPLYPQSLHELRRMTHISVDEIVTGGFHQVSLEGLCAGNVVINAADFFCKSMLQHTVGADRLPPFVHANEATILDTLKSLVLDRNRIRQLQQESFDYFDRHLRIERTGLRFLDVYKRVLGRD